MGSHSVCYQTQVNTLRLNLSQGGRFSIYLPRRDARLSCPVVGLPVSYSSAYNSRAIYAKFFFLSLRNNSITLVLARNSE